MEGLTKFDLENQALERRKVEALERIASLLDRAFFDEENYNLIDIGTPLRSIETILKGDKKEENQEV